MRKMTKRFKTWWRQQDASTAKEVLAKEAGVTGKYLFLLSLAAMVFPAAKVEKALSKLTDIELDGILSIGDGHIAAYMLALSMFCFAVSFGLSLKPKAKAPVQSNPHGKAKKKP
jgi:hypothetical protein